MRVAVPWGALDAKAVFCRADDAGIPPVAGVGKRVARTLWQRKDGMLHPGVGSVHDAAEGGQGYPQGAVCDCSCDAGGAAFYDTAKLADVVSGRPDVAGKPDGADSCGDAVQDT